MFGRQGQLLVIIMFHMQGLPLLMCIMTAIMDSIEPVAGSAYTFLSFPRMGVFNCFLGKYFSLILLFNPIPFSKDKGTVA